MKSEYFTLLYLFLRWVSGCIYFARPAKRKVSHTRKQQFSAGPCCILRISLFPLLILTLTCYYCVTLLLMMLMIFFRCFWCAGNCVENERQIKRSYKKLRIDQNFSVSNIPKFRPFQELRNSSSKKSASSAYLRHHRLKPSHL